MSTQVKKNKFKHLHISPFVLRIAMLVIEIPIHKILRTKLLIPDEVKHLPRPYILIPNHKSVFDPFINHKLRDNYLHYVVSDTHFRNPIVKFLLQKMGSIAKKKNQSDINTIKELLYVLNHLKEPVCIFAEGVNTWDGESQTLEKGTASLVKFAKVPVVVGNSHGAYYTRPRWGHGMRRGQVILSYSLVIKKEDIATFSKDDIYQKLSEAIYSNEVDNQDKQPLAFTSARRAEYIERVLFMCANCKSINSLRSNKSRIRCLSCSHEWEMDIYGSLHSLNSTPKYLNLLKSNIFIWNTWQKKLLHPFMLELKAEDSIFIDSDCKLRYGIARFSVNEGLGTLELKKDRILFHPRSNRPSQHYLLKNIRGINVQNNEKLEWSVGRMTYQIVPQTKRINTYKYLLAATILNNEILHNNN